MATMFMRLVGAGSWQFNDIVVYSSLCKAFEVGYTCLDTANGYGNQKGVGKAIKDCWKGTRVELFVMTKILGGLKKSETLAAHAENMEQLGLDYVDHLMTHYPADWDASPWRATPPAAAGGVVGGRRSGWHWNPSTSLARHGPLVLAIIAQAILTMCWRLLLFVRASTKWSIMLEQVMSTV